MAGASHLPELAAMPPETGQAFLTTGSPDNVSVSTSSFPPAPLAIHPCQQILYMEIPHSRVRVWDLIILIPNILFLVFLVYRLRTAWIKLRRNTSPIFLTFFGMVMLVAMVSLLRCVVAMTVNASVQSGDIADKVLWLIVRFFLLAIELSVVIFGLAFGHLDSRKSIQWVLLVTSFTALVYSCIQGVLEFKYPDPRFHRKNDDEYYDVFGHGGMLFWFISSTFFFLVYLVICVLPCTSIRRHFPLPSKQSFYWYTGTMMCMNLCQAVGSSLLYYDVLHGMCVVDVTSYLYFTCFAPLVYITFLWRFFATSRPQSIFFSYKTQVDVEEEEDDTVSLPRSLPAAASAPQQHKHDSMSTSYDSTHFDTSAMSPNPLYDQYDAMSGPNPLYNNTDILQPDTPLPISPHLSINADYYTVKS